MAFLAGDPSLFRRRENNTHDGMSCGETLRFHDNTPGPKPATSWRLLCFPERPPLIIFALADLFVAGILGTMRRTSCGLLQTAVWSPLVSGGDQAETGGRVGGDTGEAKSRRGSIPLRMDHHRRHAQTIRPERQDES